MNENYFGIAKALDLSKKQIYQLAKNSFHASFLDEESKKEMIAKVDEYYRVHG